MASQQIRPVMEFGIQFQPGVRLERALKGFPIDDEDQDLALRSVHRRIVGLADYNNPGDKAHKERVAEAEEKIRALGSITLELFGSSVLDANTTGNMLRIRLRTSPEGMEPYHKVLEQIPSIDRDGRPFVDSELRVRLAIRELRSRDAEIRDAKCVLDELLARPHAARAGHPELYSNQIDKYRIGPSSAPSSEAYYN